jgi:hypothetical protein
VAASSPAGPDSAAATSSESYCGEDELVFAHPESGKPLDRSKVTKRFKAACKAAGVRPVRFHDLRHTFGTRLAATGQPIRSIQEFLGHADAKTTQIYTHYAPSEREVEMVNEAFSPGGTGNETGNELSETVRGCFVRTAAPSRARSCRPRSLAACSGRGSRRRS